VYTSGNTGKPQIIMGGPMARDIDDRQRDFLLWRLAWAASKVSLSTFCLPMSTAGVVRGAWG
jgi:hypothetical protein